MKSTIADGFHVICVKFMTAAAASAVLFGGMSICASAEETADIFEAADTAEIHDEMSDRYEGDPVDISAYIEVDANGNITKYNGNDIHDIKIPSTIDDKTVTGINDDVFKNHTEIYSVLFPETLKSIGANAFNGCPLGEGGIYERYGTLTIPSSVDKIGNSAFNKCQYLGELIFENSTASEPAAIEFSSSWGNCDTFDGCINLKKITLSNRTQKLPEGFASGCSSLETVVWANNMTSIDAEAFRGDVKLISSDLSGTKLDAIGNSAFLNCSTLPQVKFPNTLKTIGSDAFKSAALGLDTRTCSLTIPSSVDSIGYGAFSGCKYLGEVIFEDSSTADPAAVTFTSSWGNCDVFENCGNLVKIKLSNRTRVLPEGFANGCTRLETVIWADNMESIGGHSFEGDISLTSSGYLSSTSIVSIGECAFNNCTSFPLVKFPATLTEIGYEAFKKTAMGTEDSPGSLEIPSSVSRIGYNSFYECAHLATVLFKDYTGPDSPAAIDFSTSFGYSDVFSECKELNRITLSNRIKVLPCEFAKNCTALETVDWSKALTGIDESAFAGCTALKTSDISGTGITYIGRSAFYGCTSFPVVKLPSTLTVIQNNAFSKAAMGAENSYGELYIPSELKTIESYAFSECSYLGKVIIGEDNGLVEGMKLDYRAFAGNPNLREIVFSGRVKTISEAIAADCPMLMFITIPESVTEIGRNAFRVDKKTETILTTSNNVARNYDWASDNRIMVDSVVTGITLDQESLNLTLGGQAQLTASMTLYPEGAPARRLKWESDSRWVAEVDENGLVTGKNEGTTVIYARVDGEGSNAYAACQVTVENRIPVSTIVLNRKKLRLPVKGTFTLVPEILPADAKNKTVKWTSSDENVVKVTDVGLVNGLIPGKATVTATALDGSGVFDTCDVEVVEGAVVYQSKDGVTATGGQVRVGDKTFDTRVIVYDYDEGIVYTGKQIKPAQLMTDVNIDSLIESVRSGLKENKKSNAEKLFKTQWILGKNKTAGIGTFYAKITFNYKKAKKWGIKTADAKAVKSAVSRINTYFRNNKNTFRIDQVDLEKVQTEVRASFKGNGKLKIKWIKVNYGGSMKKISKKCYSIISKDPATNSFTIIGKGKNFTGTRTIVIQ